MKWTDEKEKEPKKLWLILIDEIHKKFKLDKPFWQPKVSGENFWKEASEIALDWFKGILPQEEKNTSISEYYSGFNNCLAKIHQRVEKERKPKKLWRILKKSYLNELGLVGSDLDNDALYDFPFKSEAKAAIEAVERVIDKYYDKIAVENIRLKLREELL